MAYFERLGPTAFRATPFVEGAWDTSTQHIAPALGLLAHAVECDHRVRRDDVLVIGRLSYDILGTVPVDVVDVTVTMLRPGRTIELVEAVLEYRGRTIVRLRAWLMQPQETENIAGTGLTSIEPADAMEPWDPSSLWPGGFISSVEVRRTDIGPGRAQYWARSPIPLVADEEVGPTAHAARLFDLANGMAVRADPDRVAFPNVDLTAHLFSQPQGEWIGFDTSVSFGGGGIGLTHSTLHDQNGPIGSLSQILTVRPGVG